MSYDKDSCEGKYENATRKWPRADVQRTSTVYFVTVHLLEPELNSSERQRLVLDSRFFLPLCFLFTVRTTAIAVIGSNAAAPIINEKSGPFCTISIVTVVDAVRDGTDESFTTTRISNVPASSGTFQINEP